MTTTCSGCGRPMPIIRFGVPLPPLKARIVTAIERAGPDGISSDLLIADYGLRMNRKCLAAHIHQINELLAATDYAIVGRGPGYRLVRRRVASVVGDLPGQTRRHVND